MSSSKASSLQEALQNSEAYKRMKEASPDVFQPKTIYLATLYKERIDWQNCLQLKATIVYEAITGEHVTNPETRKKADDLLPKIARECKSLVEQQETKQDVDQKLFEKKPVDKGTSGEISPLTEKYYIDGVFLVVGFLSELKKNTYKLNREEADSRYLTTYKDEMVKDIIKIENQLPLKLIKDIAEKVEAAIKKQLGENFAYDTGFKGDFVGIINRFCWYYSPFHSTESAPMTKDAIEGEKLPENLLQCLYSSAKSSQNDEVGSGQAWRSPSARQLRRSGVRFEAWPKATIDVRFIEPNKLQMPALMFDFKLETVVRNLLAWECLPRERIGKPVTRYFQFMNELLGDLGDVKVMKKSGLIKGTWKNLKEVLDLVKRADGHASYPSVYMILDKEVRKVRMYHDEMMKRFFVRNRPAVLWFSSVAAASVIATAAIYASRRRGGGLRRS